MVSRAMHGDAVASSRKKGSERNTRKDAEVNRGNDTGEEKRQRKSVRKENEKKAHTSKTREQTNMHPATEGK